jgi:TetR/AcrR family transcriptional repressor of nem operon
MGRTRTFDESDVIAACTDAFLRTGYEGTSVDDLVGASGLHRGSLYAAFGSKRGIFLAALRQASPGDRDRTIDLLLVALLELAPRDPEVRALGDGILDSLSVESPSLGTAELLGARLLARAHPSDSASI